MSMSDNIKKLRKESGLTQVQLADKLDKSVRTIQKYESGEIEPSIEIINSLSKIFDVSVQDLFDKQPEDTYIVATEDEIKLSKMVHYNSDLVMDILRDFIYKGDLQTYRFVDNDLDVLTEEIKNHIISLVKIISNKNIDMFDIVNGKNGVSSNWKDDQE